MNCPTPELHVFSIDSFSPFQKAVRGPSDLPEGEALDYLAQRLSDQHRGGLAPAYWQARARAILEEARQKAGAACIHRVSRGRGVIVTAEPFDAAAVFEVRIFPLLDGDGRCGVACGTFEHPRLAIALREAGRQAEAWTSMDSEEVRVEARPATLVGFTAEITARLRKPLLAGSSADLNIAEDVLHAPLRGCSSGAVPGTSTSPAA